MFSQRALRIMLLVLSICSIVTMGTWQDRRTKTNEPGRRPIDFFLCGDQILWYYQSTCFWRRRRRRRGDDVTTDKRTANKYLKRTTRYTGTDIVEECCNEGCRYEEISEYCVSF